MKKVLFLAAALLFSAAVFAQVPNRSRVNNKNGHGKEVSAIAQQNRAELKELQEQWKSLTPQQRQARKDEFKARRVALAGKDLTPEQRAALKDRMKDRKDQNKERKEALKEQMKNMTPEQREAFKKQMKERREARANQTGRSEKANRQGKGIKQSGKSPKSAGKR